MKSIIYIGMDVHKNTYSLCAINNLTGEILGQTKCDADVKNIIKFIESVKEISKTEKTAEILTGYEAGCLGFSLLLNRTLSPLIKCKLFYPALQVFFITTANYFT